MEVSTKFSYMWSFVITSYLYASVTNKCKQLILAKLLRFSFELSCCFMSSPYVSCLLDDLCMVQANGIEDAYSLQVGQELWIPRTYQITKVRIATI